MIYAALMFDIIESRNYLDRYDAQYFVMENIHYLNYVYAEHIKKEVVPSAGDEFQGLFYDLQSAFLYARKLQLLIYPIKIRVGIGYGQIKYDVNEWDSSAFDGDAYYLARDAINSIPRRKSNVICFNTHSKYDKYLNTFCLANAEIKSEQSQMARWIELLADIILPIKYTKEDIGIYRHILISKLKLIKQETWNKVTGNIREIELQNTDFEYLFQNRNNIDEKYDNGISLYVEDTWVYGMSTCIAQSLYTTRQNIDRYVVLGKIKESRAMDKAICELLGEN